MLDPSAHRICHLQFITADSNTAVSAKTSELASKQREQVLFAILSNGTALMIEKIDPSSIVRASHTTPQLVASLLHSVAITKVVLPTTCQSFAKATIFRLLRDGSSEVAIIHQDYDRAVAVSPMRSKGEDSSSCNYLRASSIEDFCLVEVQQGHVYALLLHSDNRVLSVVAVSSGMTVSSMQCSDDQFQALSLVSETSCCYHEVSASNTSDMAAAISHHVLVMLHRKDMSQQHAAQLVSISFLGTGTSCRMVPLGSGPLMMPAQVASDLPYRITASTCRMGLIDVDAEAQPSSFISLVDAQRVTVCQCSHSVSKQLQSLLKGLMDPLPAHLHSPVEHASAMQSLGRIIHQLLQPASLTSPSESFDALLSAITPQIHCSDVLSLTYALLDLSCPPQGFVSKLLNHAEVPFNVFSSASS